MLATDQDMSEEDNNPKVTMMTVHASKGLEFNHVYIVGVEEDLFPALQSQNSLTAIEEERRLLYVAITRAKITCTITYAGSRFKNGQTSISAPSRFISDIDTRYLNIKKSSNISDPNPLTSVNPVFNYRSSNRRYDLAQKSPSGSPSSNFRKIDSSLLSNIQPRHSVEELEIGVRIRHDKFGEGEITEIGNISGEASITVAFKEVGIKRLLLKFAKFEIIK